MSTLKRKQGGVVILEALIAILLFSIGALGLVAMYANSVAVVADAQYRTEATYYANQLMNEIWINGDRNAGGNASSASVLAFAYNTGGGACVFNGAGGNAAVTNWVNRITAASGLPDAVASALPGTTAAQVQVAVNGAVGGLNQVAITICWQTPKDAQQVPPLFHFHTLVGNVK